MGKLAFISAGLLVAVGVILYMVRGCGSKGPSAQASFQVRLEAAQTQRGAERIVEGTVRATDGTTQTPHGRDVVAWASWQQVRLAAGSEFYKAQNLELGSVPFALETSEGQLLVDGSLRGLSDLVPRNRSRMSEVTLTIAPGDQVTVLGPISERDGVRGLYGEVIVVKGSYAQWHAALDKNFFPSLPREPSPPAAPAESGQDHLEARQPDTCSRRGDRHDRHDRHDR